MKHNAVFHGTWQQHLQRGPSHDGCSARVKQGAGPLPSSLQRHSQARVIAGFLWRAKSLMLNMLKGHQPPPGA